MSKKANQQDVIDDALGLINSSERDEFVAELEKSLSTAVAQTRDNKKVRIESAAPLTPEIKTRFEEVVKKVLKNELPISFITRPELIAGFRISIGDWKLDASVVNQLERMKAQLKGR